MQRRRDLVDAPWAENAGDSRDPEKRFDKAYFDRFYRDPATRSATRRDAELQADFILAYLRHLRLPIRRIVDIGCGLGRLLRALGNALPQARALGVDVSSYLCGEFGWEHAGLPNYSPPNPFDLVICYDVLPYLAEDDAAAAIATLVEVTGKALYFGALTEEDLAFCDRDRTDLDVHLRPGAWYRQRLGQRFEAIGGGLWLKKPLRTALWTLDRP